MNGVDDSPFRPPTRLSRMMWDLPRNILIVLLQLYRRLVSPLYGQVCRFFPSCSAYALEAVTVHGAVKGSYLAGRRLLRCNPWNGGGVDHVPSGGRTWDGQRRTPQIVILNHPVIPADLHSRDAA